MGFCTAESYSARILRNLNETSNEICGGVERNFETKFAVIQNETPCHANLVGRGSIVPLPSTMSFIPTGPTHRARAAARRHAQKRQRGRRYQAGLREQEEGRSSTAAAPWKASVQSQADRGSFDRPPQTRLTAQVACPTALPLRLRATATVALPRPWSPTRWPVHPHRDNDK